MPGSIDGLKLAHAVHARWPSIKIILVSGKLTPTDSERPTDSRFFGKPLEVNQMITEIQEMIGQGALKFIPPDISLLVPATGPIETQSHRAPRTSNKSANRMKTQAIRLG